MWADSEEGDIKIELNGDGRSFAKSANYRPSGYVLVFGGWNNSKFGHGDISGRIGGYTARAMAALLERLGLPKKHSGGVDVHGCLPARHSFVARDLLRSILCIRVLSA